MTTADAKFASTEAGNDSGKTRGISKVRLGAAAVVAALTLGACGASYDTYVEGYWDNGDEMRAPAKSALFDEELQPICEIGLPYQRFESRSRPYNLISAVIFEIYNTEPDPDGECEECVTDEEREEVRIERERVQGSLATLYQYTHPVYFDQELGIETSEDLASIKEELREHLDTLGLDAPLNRYYTEAEKYIEAEEGTFVLERLRDQEGYIRDNGIPIDFKGLQFNYEVATGDGGEYLRVTNRDTGASELWQGDQKSELTNSVTYVRYEVDLNVGFPNGPEASFLLISDGCPERNNSQVERFWLHSYEILFTEPQGLS